MSLQGTFYLSAIVNGVAGAMRQIGNVPEFELEIDADVVEHQESMSGQRSTDFTMVKTTSVNFSGQIEELDEKTWNMWYLVKTIQL